ncbi:MAG: ABC transporter ATP-binding protein [Weeksellaceae bacterium]|nr:ABC transporter ATP-binding protein [Weeksellaceae bacterium]
MNQEPNHTILRIDDLSIAFDGTRVVDSISFDIARGEIVGLVGESGSGKSLTSLAVMGLLPPQAQLSGSIRLSTQEGEIDLLNAGKNRQIRSEHISMIFQEPMTSLNPSMRCGAQVGEKLKIKGKHSSEEIHRKVIELFDLVQLPDPETTYRKYPHELSGGQKQRVMIAMALISEPSLLIADEPTTALDVTVQKSILDLLKKLQQELGMSILFISHDLGVISTLCDRVVVLYKGKIVETAATSTIFSNPKQPYTQGLIACRPGQTPKGNRLPVLQDFLSESSPKPNLPQKVTTIVDQEEKQVLLQVKDLTKYFVVSNPIIGKPKHFTAVENVGFELYAGETLGLVGESGSGKTTLSRCLLMLEKPSKGEILYHGKDLATISSSEMRKLRKDIQIIFQDPYSSLNPRHSILRILTEPMQIHGIAGSGKTRKNLAAELLEKVGLDADALNRYPHQFSGGQRQRIGIARALAMRPKIIICDESVSALDVSVQAQVLNLLNDLKKEFDLSYIFISHDLSVVRYMSDRLIVLRHGIIQEYGDAEKIYQNPSTQYTQELIAAIPQIESLKNQ